MAACVSISEDVLDALRKRGCPAYTVPGTKKILFDPTEVAEWIKREGSRGQSGTMQLATEKADALFGN